MRFARQIQLRRIVLLLVLGAVVNVVVAWGCCVAFEYRSPMTWPGTEVEVETLAHLTERYGSEIASGSAWMDARTGVTYAVLSFGSGRLREVWDVRAGLPVHSITGQKYYHVRNRTDPSDEIVRVSLLALAGHALPIRPIWPGFAINTMFYAAILWLLFFAPFMLRRWLRLKRGQCPACGYPVGASDVCTECGKPVKDARVAPRIMMVT